VKNLQERTTFQWRRSFAVAAVAVLFCTGLVSLLSPSPAEALSGSQFDPGYIISDEIFYNGTSMSANDVQNWLQATNPGCIINDGVPSHAAGAAWGSTSIASDCITTYRQQTPNMAEQTGACSAYPGALSERASDIIAKVGAVCNISPKVLLVLLQKEQSLITDTWPTNRQYSAATGYGCYDNGEPCVQSYAGFFYQVWSAARQFQRYGTGSLSWIPVGQVSNRPYQDPSANASCGTKPVLVRNRATAALYYYTPYTPNTAALNNLYGTGDSCSAYGNRNFWRMFSDWFGSTTSMMPAGTTATRLSGGDRYSTASAISQNLFPSGSSPVVYVTTANNFPDALSSAPAAAKGGGVVLLTESNWLPGATNDEIRRLAPRQIVVVGGDGVISAGVYNTLSSMAPAIRRDGGVDRYATSRNTVRSAFAASGSSTVYLATGEDFPDALSAGAAAGASGAPVILVRGNQGSIDHDTAQLIQDIRATTVVIAGGAGVVSSGIESSLTTVPGVTRVVRLGAANRFATSEAINSFAFSSSSNAYVATGNDFPDGLAAAAAAGVRRAPLFISGGSCITRSALQTMINIGASSVFIVGGTGVLAGSVAEFRYC
jgi:putative cell wall-binding protein